MRLIVCSLTILFLLTAGVWAENKIVPFGTNYTLPTHTYTVTWYNENTTILREGQTSTLFDLDECLTDDYLTICLEDIDDEKTATFSEEFLGAELDSTHQLNMSTANMDAKVTGTIVLRNEGTLAAEDVLVSVPAPRGLSFVRGNPNEFVWEGRVKDTNTIRYEFTSSLNGTYKLGGTVTYFDRNTTQVIDLDERTLTVTTPVSYKVRYTQNTTNDSTRFFGEVVRKDSNNYTVTLSIIFPNETTLYDPGKNVAFFGKTATYKKTLNTSETYKFNFSFAFNAPPSTDAKLTFEYKDEDNNRLRLNQSLSFIPVLDGEPSLAASVPPMRENQTGELHVVVTGTRTGTLEVSGAARLLQTATAGNYTIVIPALPQGNYTADISFTSVNAYGQEQIAQGTVPIVVETLPQEELPPILTDDNASLPDVPDDTQSEQPLTEQTNIIIFIVGGTAAVCMLAVLLLVIHTVKNPIARLEKLTDKVGVLRRAIERKVRDGTATPEERRELAQLEEELDHLGRSLR